MLLGIKWDPSLNLGDALVAAGTLLLAGFTYKLARATVALDRRVAGRERVRETRKIRGLARLIQGELVLVDNSLDAAVTHRKWPLHFVTPRRTWDRDGAAMVPAIPIQHTATLVSFYGLLTLWEAKIAEKARQTPGASVIDLSGEDVSWLAGVKAKEFAEAKALVDDIAETPLTERAAARVPVVGYLKIASLPHHPDVSTIEWLRTRRKGSD